MPRASTFVALAGAIIACAVLHGGGVWALTPASLISPAPAHLPSTPVHLAPAPASLPLAPASLPPAPASLPLAPASLPPAPSLPGPDCTTALFNLTSCLTYVEAGSTVPVPDKECCPALAGLMESNPICLCELLAGGAENFGIKIDDSKALKLPSICKVETPPPSTCTVLGYNVPNVDGMAPAPASTSGGPELPGSSTSATPPMTSGSGPEFRAAELVALAGLSFLAAAMAQVLI